MRRASARRAARRSTGRRISRCGARPAPPRPSCAIFFDRSFNRQAFAVRPGEEVNEALRGFDPATIMTAAFNGINWWCEQAALVQEMSSRRVQEECRAHAEGYKSKLLEVHSAYTRAKAKAEALWQQMQQLELDKKELQSKYEQKSGEKRRIEASYHSDPKREEEEAEEEEEEEATTRTPLLRCPPSRHAYQRMNSPPMPWQPTLGPQRLPPGVPASA